MALRDKLHPKIWKEKNYSDIILYSLSAHGPLNRREFIKDYSESVIDDEYRKYINKTTFYKYLNELFEKKFVISKRTGKFVLYEITPSGQAHLLKRLIPYDLDFLTLNRLEEKRIKSSVKKYFKFFEDYNISNEEVQIEFLQLANEMTPDKLSSFTEEQFNKLLLYLVLNNPKFYNYGEQFSLSINDFLSIYNKKEKDNLSETDVKYFIQEAVDKNTFDIKIYKLNLEDDNVFLYFRSNSEEGINFETTVKSQLKYLSYLKNISEKEIITQDDWIEIIRMILFKLIKKYKTFHAHLEKSLYSLILSFIKESRKAFQKEPTKAIMDKDLTLFSIDLPIIPQDYIPRLTDFFSDDDIIEEDVADIEFIFNSEEYRKSENFTKAREFFNQKNYRAALKYVDKAIEDSPEYFEVHEFKAHILHILKKYEQALDEIVKTIELDPDYSENYQKKAYILSDMKRFDEALISINKAIDFGEDLDMYFKDKANILFEMGKFDEALKVIEESIEFSKDWETPFYIKGKILFKLKRYEEAFSANEKAIDLNPQWGGPYYLQSRLLIKKGELAPALDQINTAIEWNPDKAENYYFKAEIISRTILESDDISKSISANLKSFYSTINSAIELDSKNPKAYIVKANMLRIENKDLQALNVIRRAIELDPNDSQTYTTEAMILAKLDKQKEAIESIDKAIKLNPQNHYYYDLKATIYGHARNYEEAINWLDKGLELKTDRNQTLRLYTSKAHYLNRLFRSDEALDTINRALEIDSNNYTAIFRKVQILNYMREYNLALELANRGIEISPNTSGCREEKIDILIKLEKFDEALKAIELWKVIFPRGIKLINSFYLRIYSRMAKSFAKKNLKQEAISTVKKILELEPTTPIDIAYFYNYYAEILMEFNDFGEAVKQLEYGLTLVPSEFKIQYSSSGIISNIIKCYRELGLPQKARIYERKREREYEEEEFEIEYKKSSSKGISDYKFKDFIKKWKEANLK